MASDKINTRYIEVIKYNSSQKLKYYGRCKIVLNSLSEKLIVKVKNGENEQISASFKWHFVKKKNMLFVLDEDESPKFVLAFNNESKCSKVHDYICKHKITQSAEVSLSENPFSLPLFRRAAESYDTNDRIKSIVCNWINQYDDEAKQEYLKLMKDNKVDDIAFSDIKHDITENIKKSAESYAPKNMNSTNSALKRKHPQENRTGGTICSDTEENFSDDEITSSDQSRLQCKKRKTDEENAYSMEVSNSMFKQVRSKQSNDGRRRLVVFDTPAKTHCYEFHWHQQQKLFVCSECRRKNHHTTAILNRVKDENFTVKLDNREHVCGTKLYDPEKFDEIKVSKKADYQIFEYSDLKTMVVFANEQKDLCYKYNWHNSCKKFVCVGCKYFNKQLAAKLCCTDDENEYIELLGDDHVCQLQDYNTEKQNLTFEFLLKPNFEIRTTQKNGKEQPTLIIFDKNDRSLCYVYHKHRVNLFACSGCNKEKKQVSAKLCKNEDGEEYVTLSNVKHICVPRDYVPEIDQILLYKPNFESMENTSTGVPKLFIFDDNDKSKSYVFSKSAGKNPKNQYYCTGCHSMPKEKRIKQINGTEVKGVVKVYLCKDESTDDYYVKMAAQNHLCKSTKYKPEIFQSIATTVNDFVLFNPKKDPQKLCVALYHPDNRNLCYVFNYFPSSHNFQCKACKKKKYAIAKLKTDDEGKEYFIHDFKRHLCKPLKFSMLKQSGIKLLEKSGLSFENKKKVDESKIIRKGDFEFRVDKNGNNDGRLIIFKHDNRNLCYEYSKYSEFYKCIGCKTATVKVGIDERGEKFITLGRNEHQCNPIMYHTEEKNIIKARNFQKFNRDYENRPEVLVIFVSTDKEMCYEMDYYPSSKNFRCQSCRKLQKCVSAKLCNNHEGEQYVQLLSEHICHPQKFNAKTYQPLIIPATQFRLLDNNEGEPNSKLIVYATEAKDTMFEFKLLKDNIYKCLRCQEKGRSIHAVLREENGKKYLEVSEKRHNCIWNANYVTQETLDKSDNLEIGNVTIKEENVDKSDKKDEHSQFHAQENFKLFEYQRSGKLVQKLIVFENNERKTCHIYIKDNLNSAFECCYCRDNYKIKIFTAKLITNIHGKSFAETENGHSCLPRKYYPEKFRENNLLRKPDYKIVEGMHDGVIKKKLIIFDPCNKDLCYVYSQKNKDSFLCMSCHILARVHNESTENEYVEMFNSEHVCDLRQYNPENLFKETKFVYEPDYEIQTLTKDGKEMKRLILFDPEDRKYCFEYTYKDPCFTCCRCKTKDHGVYATFAKDSKNKECIKLGPRSHVCERKLYIPEKDKQEVTTEVTNFKFVPSQKSLGQKNLILFDDADPTLCYEYYSVGNAYFCRGCTKTPTKYNRIKFIKNENGKYFLTMTAGQKHGCKPYKYDPEKYKSNEIVKAPNFSVYLNTDKKYGMVVYTSEDKQFCYKYFFLPSEKAFQCSECKKLNKKTRSTVHKNVQGDEYVKLGIHKCKPIKLSTIKSSIVKFIKATEIMTPKNEHQGTVINDFEIRNGKDGTKDSIVIVFDSNDKSLCYILNYRKSSKRYSCNNCGNQGAQVSAKLCNDESGNNYIVMGENPHICKPVKYEQEKGRFKNFVILEKNAKLKFKKLIIFTDDERNHCYEYTMLSRASKCDGCGTENVTAKLKKDKEGGEYVEFGKKEHICAPAIFDPTKYEE